MVIPLNQTAVNDRPLDELLQDALHAVRTHFKMEVSFISEFKSGRRFFRYVDAEANFSPISVGESHPLEESYCQRVVDGRLPELITNGNENAEARMLPATASLPVGAHMSIPIRFQGGELFGTFCCFRREPDYSLNERDLDVMRLYADFVGRALWRSFEGSRAVREAYERIRAVLNDGHDHIVYQPIIHIGERRVVGHEALTRFSAEPLRSPDKWFNEAATVGLQEELELAVIRRALAELHKLPQDSYLSLNISPETIVKGAVPAILEGYLLQRLMLEVTEHSSIEDYAQIASALAPLRKQGLRLAVDDAGAGFASFRHIIKLNPDVIKLDTSLVRGIDKDKNIRALAAALIRFAEETGIEVIAEGVETEEELRVLQQMKVNKVQGFLLGRPSAVEKLLPFSGSRLKKRTP